MSATTLERLLAGTRADIEQLRAESADHARDASAVAGQMAEPTDLLHAMEAEERDLVLKLDALRGAMKTARNALDAMADERDLHTRRADAAADAADHYEQVTLPHLAALLDGVPPAEALAATGLMPKEIPVEEHTCANIGCTSCAGCDGCTCHDPAHTCLPWDASTQTECPACREIAGNGKPVNGDNVTDLDDLPFNVVQAPADVIAAITGGTRVITDEPLRIDTVHTSGTGAGQLVATHGPTTTTPPGPTVTMPDTGLNPDPLPPAPPTAEARHAKPDRPGLLARLTGGHRTINDEQDGASGE